MELMVGGVVALVTLVFICHVFAASESLRRDIQAGGDAQQAALFILSRIGLEASNAGAGFASNAAALATCPAVPNPAATLRPIAMLIGDGGRDDTPDSLVVRYGIARGIAAAVSLASDAPAGTDMAVASVGGFEPGDRVVAVTGGGECAATDVVAVNAATPGQLVLSHGPVSINLPASSRIINFGAAADARVVRFDVSSGVLRTTDLAGGDAPNPLASNVVNLKFQYGIDIDGDGAIDTWISARDAGALGNWSATSILSAPIETLHRIKAVRAGLIVRSDLPDRAIRDTFRWVLFDCPAIDKTACPGRLTGSIPPSAAGGWRYRVYEAVLPLRNPVRAVS